MMKIHSTNDTKYQNCPSLITLDVTKNREITRQKIMLKHNYPTRELIIMNAI